MKIDELRAIAEHMRAMLEIWSKNEPSYLLRDRFPHGHCDTASELLIIYLKRYYHIQDIEFVRGQHGISNHVWVVACGYCIDITADQFNSALNEYQPVICCEPLNYPLLKHLSGVKKNISLDKVDPNHLHDLVVLAAKLHESLS